MARTTPGLLVYRRTDGAEEYIQLRHGATTLGRDVACTFVIAHPAVSRHHARIEIQDDRYVLVDTGSANGTFVNSRRIDQRHQLRSGDEIWLGAHDVSLRFSDPEERLAAQVGDSSPLPRIEEGSRTTPQALKDLRTSGVIRGMTSTRIANHMDALLKTRLPVLQTALNVEQMTSCLGPLLQPLTGAGAQPVVRYAKLLDYKQGEGGLIQYDVAGTNRGDPCLVLGKVYSEAGAVIRKHRTMHMLWVNVFGRSPHIGVPQPLGYVLDPPMLCYTQPEGRPLSDAIASEQAAQWLEKAGVWLGMLHRQRLPIERQFQLQAELANVQAWAHLIGHKWPDCAEAATRIAGYLQARANELQFAAHTPLHGNFHYGHIMVNGGFQVVECDDLCEGDPDFDLAHFCAYLRLLLYRQQTARFSFIALRSAFLSAYTQYTSWVANERFAYFYVYTCLKIAKQLCSKQGLHPRPEGEEQHRQALLMLHQGLTGLPQNTSQTTAL